MRSSPNYGTYPARSPRDNQVQSHPARSRGSDFRDRLGSGSSAYSGRTASLTSVIDGYRYSPLGFRAPQGTFSSGSFYYDYTEEFEHVQEQFISPLISPPSPLAPIPTRVLSDHHRPLVLRQDCDVHGDASGIAMRSTPDPVRGKRSQSLSSSGSLLEVRGGDVESPRHGPLAAFARQHDFLPLSGPMNIFTLPMSWGGSPVLPRAEGRYLGLDAGEDGGEATESIRNDCLLVSEEELSAASKSPERQVEIQSPGKSTIRSVQATILGLDDYQSVRTRSLSTIADRDNGPADRRSPMRTLAEGSHEFAPEEMSANQGVPRADMDISVGEDEEDLDLDGAGQADSPVSVRTLDEGARPLLPEDWVGDLRGVLQSPSPVEAPYVGSAERDVEREPRHSSRHLGYSEDDAEQEQHVLFSRRLQNDFSVRSAAQRTGDALGPRGIPFSRSETPMLAPKPISPAKELRVKNSIPQLMKALPPLPKDATTPEVPIRETSDEELEEVPQKSPLRHLAASSSASTAGNEPPTTDLDDQLDWASHSEAIPQKSPKFKVRLKNSVAGSNGTMESRPWNKDKNYPWILNEPDIKLASVGPAPRSKLVNSRLRLKMSRNGFDKDMSDDGGTVKRSSRNGRSTTVSDLSLQPPRDLFSSPGAGLRMFPRPPTPLSSRLGSESPGLESLRSSSNDAAPCCPLIQEAATNIRRGASLDTQLEKVIIPGIAAPGTPSERGTFHSERGNMGRRRFLRQKLSNLTRKAETPALTPTARLDAGSQFRPCRSGRVPSGAAMTPTHTSADTSADLASRKPLPRVPEPKVVLGSRFRRKLSRWVKGAKTAVKACVHRQRGTTSVRPDAGKLQYECRDY